jgi:hypothetical protein
VEAWPKLTPPRNRVKRSEGVAVLTQSLCISLRWTAVLTVSWQVVEPSSEVTGI